MIANAGRPLLLAMVVIAATMAFVVARFEVTTDISEFLPTGSDRARAEISQAFARGDASRTMLLTLEADTTADAIALSRAYEEEILEDAALMSSLAFFEAGPPDGIDESLWALVHPRRLSFAASNEAAAAALVDDEGLDSAAAELHRRLASPLSTLVSRIAPEDPLLATARLFERMQQGRTDALTSIEGRFIAEDRFATFIVGTKASAFDAPEQRAVLGGLEDAHERLSARMRVGKLEISALARFSTRAEETIKADIRRTTILSVAGLFALCLVVLRSFRLVLLTIIPIGCAMLAATAVSLLLYGKVHGLTFAFGASLIGVCVDYIVHLYVHHSVHPDPAGPHGTLRRIWPALLLGATTTVVGFAVIAGSSFPGLRQVAIFASVGITAALVSTRVLLPRLLPHHPTQAPLRDRLAAWLADRFHWLSQQRRLGWFMLALASSATLWGSFAVTWSDDLAAMTRLDPTIVEEDERVRQRVSPLDQGRFVVALGDTEEAALQVNDAVADALAHARDAGELGAWQSVATLLPSADRQGRIDRLIREAPDLRVRLERALATAGFNEEMFAPFFAYLEQPPPTPLRFTELVSSPAAPLVRSMRLEVAQQVAFVSLIREVREPEALAQRIEAIDGAMYVDQNATMQAAMQAYRVRTVTLLGVGLLAVMAVLSVWYRSPKVVLATLAPAVLAAGVTVATLAATNRPLDLIGLTSILMILSIGVDYGVFLAQSRHDPARGLPATLLALVVCWASTVLGFGVLALSEHPMMNTIGVVAAVGVTASLVLAPTTLALLGTRGDVR
jgi:predicted exporter